MAEDRLLVSLTVVFSMVIAWAAAHVPEFIAFQKYLRIFISHYAFTPFFLLKLDLLEMMPLALSSPP